MKKFEISVSGGRSRLSICQFVGASVLYATQARSRHRYRISNRRGRPRGIVVGDIDGPCGTTPMSASWTAWSAGRVPARRLRF